MMLGSGVGISVGLGETLGVGVGGITPVIGDGTDVHPKIKIKNIILFTSSSPHRLGT